GDLRPNRPARRGAREVQEEEVKGEAQEVQGERERAVRLTPASDEKKSSCFAWKAQLSREVLAGRFLGSADADTGRDRGDLGAPRRRHRPGRLGADPAARTSPRMMAASRGSVIESRSRRDIDPLSKRVPGP